MVDLPGSGVPPPPPPPPPDPSGGPAGVATDPSGFIADPAPAAPQSPEPAEIPAHGPQPSATHEDFLRDFSFPGGGHGHGALHGPPTKSEPEPT